MLFPLLRRLDRSLLGLRHRRRLLQLLLRQQPRRVRSKTGLQSLRRCRMQRAAVLRQQQAVPELHECTSLVKSISQVHNHLGKYISNETVYSIHTLSVHRFTSLTDSCLHFVVSQAMASLRHLSTTRDTAISSSSWKFLATNWIAVGAPCISSLRSLQRSATSRHGAIYRLTASDIIRSRKLVTIDSFVGLSCWNDHCSILDRKVSGHHRSSSKQLTSSRFQTAV